MFYLWLYCIGHMVKDNSTREETCCSHYSFGLAVRNHLYAAFYRQDSTYHGLCYTSHGVLAETKCSCWISNSFLVLKSLISIRQLSDQFAAYMDYKNYITGLLAGELGSSWYFKIIS